MTLVRNDTIVICLFDSIICTSNVWWFEYCVNVFGYLVLQVVTHGKIRVEQVVVGARVVAKDTIVVEEIGAATILEEATSRIMVVDQ